MRNTFIHYDEAAERPGKLRRVSSAPAAIKCTRVRHPAQQNAPTEHQEHAPARKRARMAAGDEEGGARLAGVAVDAECEVTAELEQRQPRGRSRTKCFKKPHAKNECKELTEQVRFEKAKEWVSKMKETDGYKAYHQHRISGDEHALAAPRTPDPAVRLSSKRQWEKAILSWRISLRRWGPVSVSIADEE